MLSLVTFADIVAESTRTSVNAPSPEKGMIIYAAVESETAVEHPPLQSPSPRLQDAARDRKVSTTAGSRREHHGSKEGSLSGSRSKRRGTQEHVDNEGKVLNSGSANTSKGKDKKDRASKNGTKSAKRVVIDGDRATTIAGRYFISIFSRHSPV